MGFSTLSFCCCGCADEKYWLNPDRYAPVGVRCFVKTSTALTVHTQVTYETRRNGQLWNITSDPRVTVTHPAVEVDSVDEELIAGKFSFRYADETQTSVEVTTSGIDTVRTITETVTEKRVEIVRKLAVLFHVDDIFDWDKQNRFGNSLLRNVKLNLGRGSYQPDDFTGTTNNTVAATLHGFWADQSLPETVTEFESLLDDPPHTESVDPASNSDIDILDWSPGKNGDVLLLATDLGDDSGCRLGVDFPLWLEFDFGSDYDATSSDEQFDWHTFFNRTASGTYESLFALPLANYRMSLGNLVPDDYFHYQDNKLKIELLETTGDVVVFDAEFSCGPTGETIPAVIGGPCQGLAYGQEISQQRYVWSITSKGTWGEVHHTRIESSRQSWTSDPLDAFDTLPPPVIDFRIREEVIEMTGGEVKSIDDITVNDHWNWITYHAAEGEKFSQLRLRITFIGDDPQPGYMTWKAIAHPDDGKNLECPHDVSCAEMEPYISPEFDVLSLTLTGADDAASDVIPTRSWAGCTFTYSIDNLRHDRDLSTTLETANVSRGGEYIARQWDADANPFYRLVYPPAYRVTGEITAIGYQCSTGDVVPSRYIGESGVGVYVTGFGGPVTELCGGGGPASYYFVSSQVDRVLDDPFLGQNITNPNDILSATLPRPAGEYEAYEDHYMSLPEAEVLSKTYNITITATVKNGLFDSVLFYQWPETAPGVDEVEGYMVSDEESPAGFQPGVGSQFVSEGGAWRYTQQLFLHTYDREFTQDEITFLTGRLDGGEYWYAVQSGDDDDVSYLHVTPGGQEGPFTESGFVPPPEELIVDVVADLEYETASQFMTGTPSDDGLEVDENGIVTAFTIGYNWHTGPMYCSSPDDTSVRLGVDEYPPNVARRADPDWPILLTIDVQESLSQILVGNGRQLTPSSEGESFHNGRRRVTVVQLDTEIVDGICPTTNGKPRYLGSGYEYVLPSVYFESTSSTHDLCGAIGGVVDKYGLVFDGSQVFDGTDRKSVV